MKRNVGSGDQILRVILGSALLVFYFMRPMALVWQDTILIVAAVLLLTGLTGRCPLYRLFHINSWHFKPPEKS